MAPNGSVSALAKVLGKTECDSRLTETAVEETDTDVKLTERKINRLAKKITNKPTKKTPKRAELIEIRLEDAHRLA
jgi:ferritin-like metal-binding protein YciE